MPVVKCPKCGYIWNYKGRRKKASCPNCKAQIDVEKNRLINMLINVNSVENEIISKNLEKDFESGFEYMKELKESLYYYMDNELMLPIIAYKLVKQTITLLIIYHCKESQLLQSIYKNYKQPYPRNILEKAVLELVRFRGLEIIQLWDIGYVLYERGWFYKELTLESMRERVYIILNIIEEIERDFEAHYKLIQLQKHKTNR